MAPMIPGRYTRTVSPIHVRHWRCVMRPLPFGTLAMLAMALPPARETPCANLSPREAAVLLYFMPVGEELRAKGMDIASERAPKAETDSNAYVFWVFNSKRTDTGTVTVGYYEGNKCTPVF